MNDLRIPKLRVNVDVTLRGGVLRKMAVFLAEFASNHAGAERVSDLLCAEGDFFPALDLQSNAMAFVNRAAVELVRLDAGLEVADEEQHSIPTEHEVAVRLADGQELRGLISFVMPPDRSRLVDYLNERAPFIRLIEGDRVALINKRNVLSVETVKG